MNGRCEGGHVVPLRELNLVIISQGFAWQGRRSPMALVCNDCMADAFTKKRPA